jgi:Tyrosyl-DNA phosphodiesterase
MKFNVIDYLLCSWAPKNGRMLSCRYTGNRVAWCMLGSHNLSKAAWGELQKGASSLFIRSYEVSVLLLPELEAAYRRHPHSHYSCTASAAAATSVDPLLRCPAAAVGSADPQGRANGAVATQAARNAPSTSRDAGSTIAFIAAFQEQQAVDPASNHSHDHRVVQVPLPLPYRLPPPSYVDGDEPWLVDVLRPGSDALNRRMDDEVPNMAGISQELVQPYFDENN